MADNLFAGLCRFRERCFPRYRRESRQLIEQRPHRRTRFIGCSDSRTGAEAFLPSQ
jgi:carbonic anhydrase